MINISINKAKGFIFKQLLFTVTQAELGGWPTSFLFSGLWDSGLSC